ncbi:MAG: hypothetical protein H0U27_10000 [Nitrosopumilus sp.]|jgi:glycosyltransferase involved in cell wall biosynthesis|nr:hypothetical protein [Nitrosopumilus sp.]
MVTLKDKNILFVGMNYASVMDTLAGAFREKGFNVKSISLEESFSPYNNYFNTHTYFEKHKIKHGLGYRFYKIKKFFYLLKHVLWADIVHVYSRPSYKKIDFYLISIFVKWKIVTFLGSEVRIPDVTKQNNKFYQDAVADPFYEYKNESFEYSSQHQMAFIKWGYKAIVWDVKNYLIKEFSKHYEIVPHASNNYIEAAIVNKPNAAPVVMHAPSAPIAKGTKYIVNAVNNLKKKGIPFKFILVKDKNNEEYQKLLLHCDILIDQMVWGAYGIASQQALQMGKVVICYISEDNALLYGKDCPVVNANGDNLETVLERLLLDEKERKRISQDSKAYYQKQHNPERVVEKMVEAYKKLFQINSRGT